MSEIYSLGGCSYGEHDVLDIAGRLLFDVALTAFMSEGCRDEYRLLSLMRLPEKLGAE
jgi:hypothetical protein